MTGIRFSKFENVLSFDVFDALHKLLKPPDTLMQSSNDLVAVTARNCANVVDDSGLKLDEFFFPFHGHSTSPLYRQRHPIFVIIFPELFCQFWALRRASGGSTSTGFPSPSPGKPEGPLRQYRRQ